MRKAMIVALVLSWAAQAGAECGWVFWSHPIRDGRLLYDAWVPTSSATSLEECREIQGRFSREETKCLPGGVLPVLVTNPIAK